MTENAPNTTGNTTGKHRAEDVPTRLSCREAPLWNSVQADGSMPVGLFVGGLLSIALACVMSGLLVLDHIGGLSLPGCGVGSPCADAANSVWGKVPGIQWPVSFLGFAYFVGALIAWPLSRGGVPPLFRCIVRFGALISLGFVLIIFIEGHLCSYCLASHAGNFGFWVCVELARKRTSTSLAPVVSVALVFVVASVVLGVAESQEKQIVEAQQEQELAESTAEIIAASRQRQAALKQEEVVLVRPKTDPTEIDKQTADKEPITEPAPRKPEIAAPPDQPEAAEPGYPFATEKGFAGRYHMGPEEAPVRLLMFTDYQCTDCKRIEAEVRKMMQQRDDVWLSVKHFPMSAGCNPRFEKHNMHPNACWAARAAETAGILRGDEGFWEMHHWLFDQKGSFTNESLPEDLREMGYDPHEFIQIMSSQEVLDLVKQDIEEGVYLGLFYTPMVFINGKQLRGVFARNAVPRAVSAVASEGLPPMTAESDVPPPAIEKYVGDWREQRARPIPPGRHDWTRGPADAKIKIVIWGDFQEPYTADADGIIRELIRDRESVRYSFRHYPFNDECNPVVSRSIHPLACRAAQAAEAAGTLGGVDGYWKMHIWLMENQKQFSDDTLRQAAAEMGFDADALFETMESPTAGEAITEDSRQGKPYIVKGIPAIYVNGKWVPRFKLAGHNVLERILDEAGEE